MKARVTVTLKRSVMDPQGKAVGDALRALGYKGVQNVRQGKYFELDLNGTDRKACREEVDAMCRKLLANPVIEEYNVDWIGDV